LSAINVTAWLKWFEGFPVLDHTELVVSGYTYVYAKDSRLVSYKGCVKKVFPLPLWLEHLTSVTNQLIQLAYRVAGRGLVNLPSLDIVETEIYLGGA
jgi:hypothetical protein